GVPSPRYVDPPTPALLDPALPVARVARVAEDPSLATAGRTARDVDQGAEDRLGLPSNRGRATAGGAGLGAGARLGPRAGAVLAGCRAGHLDLPLGTLEGLLEGDRQVVAQVVPAHRAASRPGRP